jgi:hypothetical protein
MKIRPARIAATAAAFLGTIACGTAQAQASVKVTRADADVTNVYYALSFSGSPQFRQIYIDVDKRSDTGYKVLGIGADYLLENGHLRRYTGTTGSDWSFSQVVDVDVHYVGDATTASWYFPSSALGNPTLIDAVGAINYPSAWALPVVHERNPNAQPFASTSVWNRPIGSGASFSTINLTGEYNSSNTWADMPQPDEDKVVLTPSAPLTPIYYSSVGWTQGGNRCVYDTPIKTIDTLPMPATYFVEDSPTTSKTNSSAAILKADGRTVMQMQPFARCSTTTDASGNHYATSFDYWWQLKPVTIDLYTNDPNTQPDRLGSHGGSGMSALGGTLRVGELRPGSVGPRHALKIEVDTFWTLHSCSTMADCYTWPAQTADGKATTWYGSTNPNPGSINPAMKMGALLAIPGSVSMASLNLQTEPARQLFWTLQNYGAYIVDGRGGPGFTIVTEDGPNGNKLQEFKNDYQYDFHQRLNSTGAGGQWAQDVFKLMGALQVVTNNTGSTTCSGGGSCLQPLLPELTAPH